MTALRKNSSEALAEPLAPLPSLRKRGDWSARLRTDLGEAHRYSRFVTIMKRALPMAAAALLAAVLAYSLQPRQRSSERIQMTFARWGIVDNDLAMIKPRLTGADGEGNPYVVTAEEGVQDVHNQKLARLKHVEGDLTLRDGTWINATATRGFLDASAQTMKLGGDVAVYSDNGYEMHSTAADIDMKNGIVTGDRSVTGQGPLGTYRADTWKLDRTSKQVFLHGNVRMTIYGGRKTAS